MVMKEVFKFANPQFSSYLALGEISISASKLSFKIFLVPRLYPFLALCSKEDHTADKLEIKSRGGGNDTP